MSDDDLVYLLRRAAEERIRVAQAVGEEARRAHLGLAEGYDARLHGKSSARRETGPLLKSAAL